MDNIVAKIVRNRRTRLSNKKRAKTFNANCRINKLKIKLKTLCNFFLHMIRTDIYTYETVK